MRSVSSVRYVDDFLSVFERPRRTHTPPHHQKTISSENLLKRPTPAARATPLEERGDPWGSEFARRIPWFGGLALTAVILCAAADGIIL